MLAGMVTGLRSDLKSYMKYFDVLTPELMNNGESLKEIRNLGKYVNALTEAKDNGESQVRSLTEIVNKLVESNQQTQVQYQDMTNSYNKLAEVLYKVLPQVATPQLTSQGAIKKAKAPSVDNQPIASTSTTNTYGSVDVDTMTTHNAIVALEMSRNKELFKGDLYTQIQVFVKHMLDQKGLRYMHILQLFSLEQ